MAWHADAIQQPELESEDCEWERGEGEGLGEGSCGLYAKSEERE